MSRLATLLVTTRRQESSRHLQLAVRNDEELRNRSPELPSHGWAGVLTNIQAVLLPKKTEKKAKEKFSGPENANGFIRSHQVL